MSEPMKKILIMGAAGRDFHNFNVAFRKDPNVRVVAFTATQIPYISDRRYPAELSGPGHPDGIQIFEESEVTRLIGELEVDEVVFAYSDISHEYVMHAASTVLAAGADFRLMGPQTTMIASKVPVVSICAVRTGSGKSQTTRRVAQVLEAAGIKIAVVRHPMPYGDLVAQSVQRFATIDDLKAHKCTIEEREEYEPHLREGRVVYAGVDYGAILERAESEAQVVVWDGGNNDLPFYKPDLHIVVIDPLRAGNELRYHPGETNLRMADVVVINKVDSATEQQLDEVQASIDAVNPGATVVRAESNVQVEDASSIKGKRVLVIEDGPTLTHGEMTYGAGVVAARRNGAAEVVDPRPWATGTIKDVYAKYQVGPVLPAMGYSDGQISDMQETINSSDVDVVLIATPIDLRKLMDIDKPALRVSYELAELGSPNLAETLKPIIDRALPKR